MVRADGDLRDKNKQSKILRHLKIEQIYSKIIWVPTENEIPMDLMG